MRLVYVTASCLPEGLVLWRTFCALCRPGGTREFNSPNRAALILWAFVFDEGGSLAFEKPYVGIRRLLAYDRSDQSCDASNVHFHVKAHSFAGRVGNRERVLAFGGNYEFYETRFWSGDDHGQCRFRRGRRNVLQHGQYNAICEVGGEFKAIGDHFFPTLVVGVANGDLPGGTID